MIRQAFLDKNHRVRPRTAIAPQYICIHSTGNPNSSADSERRWLDNPDNKRDASWHIVIDAKEAVQAIPLTEMAWHAGSLGNRESIGIEICESGDRAATVNHAAKIVAKLLKERNWGVEHLKRHYDYTQKSCPSIFMANNWSEWSVFKQKVNSELKLLETKNNAPQWQIDALKAVTTKLNLDKAYWTESKLTEPITVGELMGLLNKIV